MKKLLLISFVLVIANLTAQNPNGWDTAWVNVFGGTNVDTGRDIKETSDKGFIIVGTSSSFGNGNTSFYIIKTDSLGTHQWSKSIGSGNNDIGYSVDISDDGGYFFSGTSNWNLQDGYDGFLVKTDDLGNVEWTKNYGGSDWDFIYNSCKMPDGGLMLCGETFSGTNGGTDGYIIRINVNGDTLWTKKIGGLGNDCFYSIEQTNNRIYVVGKKYNDMNGKSDASIYKLDFSGNVLNQSFFTANVLEDYEYKDLYITNTNDILVCGKRSNNVDKNYIIRKVDTTSFSEIASITSNQNYHFNCIIEGNNNDIYSLGSGLGGSGGSSALFYRLNSTLSYMQSANFGGTSDEEGFEFIRTSKGYAFIGWTKSYGNQNNVTSENVYLVVFNKNDLVNDYFLIVNTFQNSPQPIGLKESYTEIENPLIYPNPISKVSRIRLKDSKTDGKTIRYQLYDQQGKIVNEEDLLVIDKHILINRGNLKSGIYTYKISLNSIQIGSGKLYAD